MTEIIYKIINDNCNTLEHKATIHDDSIDSVIHGAVSVLQSEWGETATEQAIRKYFNI